MADKKRTQVLLKAIDIVGGQSELARKLSLFSETPLRQGHVSTWLWKNKAGLPPEYCIPIEKITGGRVRACDLRPDIYPPKIYAQCCGDDFVSQIDAVASSCDIPSDVGSGFLSPDVQPLSHLGEKTHSIKADKDFKNGDGGHACTTS